MNKCIGCIYFFEDDWDTQDPKAEQYCHLYIFGSKEECDKEDLVDGLL